MNLAVKNIAVFLGKAFFIFRKKAITNNPKKILIIRSGGIGDVLMSTPLIRAIRKNYKDAEITYFVGNWSKDVLKDNPDINKLYSYNDLIIINMNIPGILKIIRSMRKEKFDLCFNLEKSWHWGVLSYLFKARSRVGFDRFGEGFAYNKTVPFTGEKYELEYYLDLARALGIDIPSDEMEIHTTKAEEDKARKFSLANSLFGKNVIGIAPGGADNPAQQALIKRWPTERYIELINSSKGYYFILFGGKNDIETCLEIRNKVKNKNMVTIAAGTMSLKESAALMKYCRTFITHDSGPMHLAAASKVNLIALFGPTQSERFAPKKATLIKTRSPPSYTLYGDFTEKKDIMSEITAEEVIRHITDLHSTIR